MVNQTFIEEVIEELYKRLQIGESSINKKVLVLFGEIPKVDLMQLTSIYDVIPYKDEIINYDAIVIGNMTIDMLGCIATGCCKGRDELFILKALLQEKSVYIIDSGMEYKKYKETAFKNLYSLYSDYEIKLIQYGMKRITNILELINDVKTEQIPTDMTMDVDLTYKNLILESDLSKACRKGFTSITIKDRCIITPLALDYMKDHYIKINKV